MRTFAYTIAIMTGVTLANTAEAADPKGPRLGFDAAALEQRMTAPNPPMLDMMTTGSIAAHRTFNVVFLDDLAASDPARQGIEKRAADPAHLAAARAFVKADSALVGELKAQNLDADNVVGVTKDPDGTNVIYVR